MSDDERPRKSWREIDKQRDRSAHRREERPAGSRPRDLRRQRTYRDKLDHLFESGRIGEVVSKSAEETEGAQGENRIKLLRQLAAAEGRDTVTAIIDAYLARFDLPRDIEVLSKVLEHRNPDLQLKAMELLLQLVDEQKPRRTRAVVGQLKLIRDTAEDADLVPLAEQLLEKLD